MKRLGLSLKPAIASALACSLAVLASQRGQAGPPSDQFQVGAEVVTDTKTHLIWQKDLAMTEATFAEAQTYCANLTLDEETNWRAPSIKELQTLVDEEKLTFAAEETAFPELGTSFWIWSSTPVAGDPNSAWRVDFRAGIAEIAYAPDQHAVRCVR